MFKLKNDLLPKQFQSFAVNVSEVHNYRTRSAANQNLSLPKAKTNYGKFNIRLIGAKTSAAKI